MPLRPGPNASRSLRPAIQQEKREPRTRLGIAPALMPGEPPHRHGHCREKGSGSRGPNIVVGSLLHLSHDFRVHIGNPAAYFISLKLVHRITRRNLVPTVCCLAYSGPFRSLILVLSDHFYRFSRIGDRNPEYATHNRGLSVRLLSG
jgi:hypothetical protein